MPDTNPRRAGRTLGLGSIFCYFLGRDAHPQPPPGRTGCQSCLLYRLPCDSGSGAHDNSSMDLARLDAPNSRRLRGQGPSARAKSGKRSPPRRHSPGLGYAGRPSGIPSGTVLNAACCRRRGAANRRHCRSPVRAGRSEGYGPWAVLKLGNTSH